MDRQILRDKQNRMIGIIETDSNDIQTLRDKTNKKLATYDPKTNKTRDIYGHLIGTGNLMMTLLY